MLFLLSSNLQLCIKYKSWEAASCMLFLGSLRSLLCDEIRLVRYNFILVLGCVFIHQISFEFILLGNNTVLNIEGYTEDKQFPVNIHEASLPILAQDFQQQSGKESQHLCVNIYGQVHIFRLKLQSLIVVDLWAEMFLELLWSVAPHQRAQGTPRLPLKSPGVNSVH